MTAPAPKEEPAAVAAGPRSPRKRRAASRSRMDYATMHAMADLQYALSKGAFPSSLTCHAAHVSYL